MILHRFRVADVEDMDLWVERATLEFLRSEKGQWAVANALHDVYYDTNIDAYGWGYICVISAEFTPENITFFNLKWGGDTDVI